MTFIREGKIPVVSGDSSYTQFLNNHLRALKPCLISGLTTVWTGTREWTCRDPSTGKLIPNFSLLKELFGAETGCITFCSETDHYGELIQRELPVSSFITSFSNDASRKTYLKDFHFMRHLQKPPYSVPQFFADDWYNRFATANPGTDDFRFMYLGEDGSFTGLHHDVCMSHSWSTSLTGEKVWTLIPPEYAHLLSNERGVLPKSIDSTDPQFKNLREAREHAITVHQYPGETIFVPSGWHHQVLNKGPTLSINHNWCNASCIHNMFSALCTQHVLSTNAISDVRDSMDRVEFEGLVQGLLKANWGMNWAGWWELVDWNIRNRGDVERFPEDEEREIVSEAVEEWLGREEAGLLKEVRDRVLALMRFLMGK